MAQLRVFRLLLALAFIPLGGCYFSLGTGSVVFTSDGDPSGGAAP